MALWLVLVLVLSVENGTVRGNSVDIMDAIINQVVISMQREMDSGLKSGTVEPEKEELPEEEGVHPSTVLLDNWIRIIKKEMEKIGLMPSPDFETGEKRTSDLATRIIKKGGQQNDGQAEDLESPRSGQEPRAVPVQDRVPEYGGELPSCPEQVL